MKNISKYAVVFVVLAATALPFTASAHATPVSSQPGSSATVASAPESVVIRFSERIDPAASSIAVRGPSGATVSNGAVRISATDPRELDVPMRSGGEGTYLVSWSVVSADDGHFTKGAYPFAVGAGVRVDTALAQDTEIVQISGTPESAAIAIELMGNGFILAVLLLTIFALRPLRAHASVREHARLIARGYMWIFAFGLVLVYAGALGQVLIKGQSLAGLRGLGLSDGIRLYMQTTAGTATLARIVAATVTFAIALSGRSKILASVRITVFEIAMLVSMSFFEYYRAVISHATANPFHPHLSVAVNFVHLIEKDFWAGALGIALLIACSKRLAPLALDAMQRLSVILAVDVAAVSLTACYIVWLHLKSFSNLFSTQWGVAFMQLLIMALALVAMRLYHMIARILRPRLFARMLPFSLAAEFAFAMLVVYCSSVVIITSPPLPLESHRAFAATDQGISIELSGYPYEDGMALLSITGDSGPATPDVQISAEGSDESVSVAVAKRFQGGYVFPTALLPKAARVEISVPQAHGYDAHADFAVTEQDFEPVGQGRSFDFFTDVMIAIALCGLVFAYIVYRLSTASAQQVGLVPRRGFSELAAGAVFLAAAFLGGECITAYAASPLSNPYKAQCEADGNMWHLMLPSVAGVPVSQTPREGCMWGMGSYAYQFPDERQYEYLSALPKPEVTLVNEPQHLAAGIPTTLTFSLKNPDGTPAKLLVDMEKYIHVVIVSKDQSVFAHIHPDDTKPLTQEAIDSSVYSVRYTFPKAGTYLVSTDFAGGTQLQSKQFIVQVGGVPLQAQSERTYASQGMFDGYDVSLDYGSAFAGEVTTIQYTVKKNGQPVGDMVPYLSAVAHVSVVKNDLATFIHTHGEFHAPGTPLPSVTVKNGQVIHSMAAMTAPSKFGPTFDAHLVFPERGRYTVWTEFKVGTTVVPTAFTVDVQ